MKSEDVAWAAGLIEGEGCFTLHSKYHPYFLLDMCDLDVLEKFHKIFPDTRLCGPYLDSKHPHKKPRYRIAAFGPKCIEIMNAVYPHLCSRRQAKITELYLIYAEATCDVEY